MERGKHSPWFQTVSQIFSNHFKHFANPKRSLRHLFLYNFHIKIAENVKGSPNKKDAAFALVKNICVPHKYIFITVHKKYNHTVDLIALITLRAVQYISRSLVGAKSSVNLENIDAYCFREPQAINFSRWHKWKCKSIVINNTKYFECTLPTLYNNSLNSLVANTSNLTNTTFTPVKLVTNCIRFWHYNIKSSL